MSETENEFANNQIDCQLNLHDWARLSASGLGSIYKQRSTPVCIIMFTSSFIRLALVDSRTEEKD